MLDIVGCKTYVEWSSWVACKKPDSVSGATKEVKCYVHDKDGHKRDLTPLVKTSGAYLVDSEDDSDLYINVCRDIKTGTDV